MKKNIMLRLSAVLLVAVLLTTCVISGTWAKYTTTDNASDSATVAKWGVTVDVAGDATAVTELDGSAETHIKTNTGELLAPGTKGTLGQVTINGTPEVAVTIGYNATVTLGGTWEDKDGDYYCPLVVKVNGTAVTAGATAAEYEANIKAAIEKCCKTDGDLNVIPAGTDLSAAEYDVVITWEWAFETGANADEIAANNINDTYLGDLLADLDDANDPKITIALTCTVTQVD